MTEIKKRILSFSFDVKNFNESILVFISNLNTRAECDEAMKHFNALCAEKAETRDKVVLKACEFVVWVINKRKDELFK